MTARFNRPPFYKVSGVFIAVCFFVLILSLRPVWAAEDLETRLPVVAEGRLAAYVAARMTQTGAVEIAPEGLAAWVGVRMEQQSSRDLDDLRARGGFLPLDDFAAAGLVIVYDGFDAVLRMTPDAARTRRQEISIKSPHVSPDDTVVPPAKLAAYLNMRGGMEYVSGDSGLADGRQPLRLDFDGALNFHGTVIEAQADYLENDPQSFRRGDVRMVRDFPDLMLRAAAGDLSYPVTSFQSFQPMFGVSLARNFSLQPYRVTVPTGDTSFVVQTPSRVDILVNGQRLRSLRLEPGSYDVSDFPVADGANDVTLMITDATGQVEMRRFPLLADRQLLKKGLHAYAYSAGIAADKSGRQIEYETDRPTFSGFHRYGVTETMTVGAQAQGDADVQQLGASWLKATGYGTFGLDAAGSHADGAGFDGAAQISYRYADVQARQDFSAQLRWRGADFAALGQLQPVNPAAYEMAARYNFMLPYDITSGIGGRYRFGRDDAADDWSYTFNAGKSFSSGVTVSFTAEHRRDEGMGAFLTLSWTPPSSPHSFQAVADSFAGTQEMRWDYRPAQDIGAAQAYAALLHEDGGGVHGSGGLGWRGYRGDISLRHDTYRDVGGRNENRSQILAGTALAYADGVFALSRPISGSFVMLRQHETLAGQTIGVNPSIASAQTGADSFRARMDHFGPAVLPDATAYMYYPVRVDTRFLPVGYDVGRDLYTVFPSYRSGTVLTVGHPGNIYAEGKMILPDGTPAALMGGEIRAVAPNASADTPAQEFFTNAEGGFHITGLAPGRYVLTLHRFPRRAASIDIPVQKTVGFFDAGNIVLPEHFPDRTP